MENLEQAWDFTFFRGAACRCSCGASWSEASPPAASSRLRAGSRKRMSHPENNPVQQSPDADINATSAWEDNRSLPPFGSPGCTVMNPASPPTPCELIRKILLPGSSNLQRRGLQTRLWLWTRPVVFRLEGGSPSQDCSSAILSFEKGWRNNNNF